MQSLHLRETCPWNKRSWHPRKLTSSGARSRCDVSWRSRSDSSRLADVSWRKRSGDSTQSSSSSGRFHPQTSKATQSDAAFNRQPLHDFIPVPLCLSPLGFVMFRSCYFSHLLQTHTHTHTLSLSLSLSRAAPEVWAFSALLRTPPTLLVKE